MTTLCVRQEHAALGKSRAAPWSRALRITDGGLRCQSAQLTWVSIECDACAGCRLEGGMATMEDVTEPDDVRFELAVDGDVN